MSKKYVICVDTDDVLGDCNGYAIKQAGLSINIEALGSWDNHFVKEYEYLFHDPNFIASQPVLPGAKKFIAELRKRNVDLLFVTAVKPDVATARIQWLMDNFDADYKEVIIGSRKDAINADIMIDDAPHNVLSSIATWPILFRRPWNSEVTGMLAVNNFDDLLLMIDSIMNNQQPSTKEKHDITCLVGPSGAGKTEIIKELLKQGYSVPKIKTTAESKAEYYETVAKDEFIQLKDIGGFVETTSYAGDSFGITFRDMNEATDKGNVVIPIDICGANALKGFYKNRVYVVYIKKSRDQLIANVLAKNISDKCKVLRILALDTEAKNAELCDAVVTNNNAKEAAEIIKGEN